MKNSGTMVLGLKYLETKRTDNNQKVIWKTEKMPAQINTKRLTRRHLSMKKVVHTTCNLVLHKYVELFSHFDWVLVMTYRKTDA